MIVTDIEQGSPEWFDIRAVLPTTSGFDMIMTPSTLKPSRQAEIYMYQIIAGKLGAREDVYSSDWMERGKELEGQALAYYEMVTLSKVQNVAFVYGPDKKYGASPDGLVGDDGGVEVKCPKASTHVKYLSKGGAAE